MANHREGSGVFRACGLAMFLFSCKSRDDSMTITVRMFSRSVVLQFDDFSLFAVMANHREGSAIFRICGLAKMWLAP